jgi:biopolymer transport protein ExbB
MRARSQAPGVHTVDAEGTRGIAALVRGSEARVPVDVSSGDALKVAAARKGFFEHLEEGGAVVVPLVIIALWSFVLVVLKWRQLGRECVVGGAAVDRVLAAAVAGDHAGARAATGDVGDPLGPVLREAVEHRSARREHIEEILHERILMYVPRLEKHLGTLAVFGGVAPLLGLLGTVTGMIHTFQLVTVFGTGEATLLSGGISEALVTTEVGLAIAIPVLLVHAYLVRRVRGVVADLEQSAADFVERLKVDESS